MDRRAERLSGAGARWDDALGGEDVEVGVGQVEPGGQHRSGKGLSREEFLTKTEGLPLTDDATVCTSEIAGGEFGSPLKRPVERVLADVLDGYVSPERAEAAFGAVIDPATMTVKEAETAIRRDGLAREDQSAL